MIEVYKCLHEVFPELMTGILFGSENLRSVRFGVDAVAFRATQLWQKVPMSIKDSSSLEVFKPKIKLRSCDDCLCKLCKRFIANFPEFKKHAKLKALRKNRRATF